MVEEMTWSISPTCCHPTPYVAAWCGDSRAVLARETGGRMEVVPLTEDHKPNSPGELERIDEAGGRVARLQDESGEEVGPDRVWLRYAWIPGLAMSRALGDALAHRVGVSSVPEISTHEISASDRFLILASDGIWEFITNEEAVMIAASCNSPDEARSCPFLFPIPILTPFPNPIPFPFPILIRLFIPLVACAKALSK